MFLHNPIVEIYEGNFNGKQQTLVRLTRLFEYILPNKDMLIIPNGFISDGASIPKPLWFLVGYPIESDNLPAALVHDYLCRLEQKNRDTNKSHAYTWQEVHKIFLHALLDCKVPEWKANLMYRAVYARWVVDKSARW
jgi:hypothetical protein